MRGENTAVFALHRNNTQAEPVAMKYTSRIRYWKIEDDRDAAIHLQMDESGAGAHPVLRGWHVPYADGYEVISVVPAKNSILVRAE